MTRRSEHAEQVGEWINTRRAQLGMTQAQLAKQVGVDVKSVSNAESGANAVAQLKRPAWEKALGWPLGSLTAAYKRGEHPMGQSAGVTSLDGDRQQVLDRAGIPPELTVEIDVREILESNLPAEGKVRVLRAWLTAHHTRRAFVQLYEDERRR